MAKTNSKTAKEAPKKPRKKELEKPKNEKKTAKCPRKTQDKISIFAINFCGAKLTAMQLRFVACYVTPGQPGFHNAYQAALKAGYSAAFAKSDIYALLQSPDIQRVIKANEKLIHDAVHSGAMRSIELKLRRAFFDPLDFFEQKEITVKTKNLEYQKKVMELKDIQGLAPELRECIDGFGVQGPGSDPVYLLPDREKVLSEIIKLDNEYSKNASDTGEEETREIIMERVTIRETKRAQRSAGYAESDFVERPEIKGGQRNV